MEIIIVTHPLQMALSNGSRRSPRAVSAHAHTAYSTGAPARARGNLLLRPRSRSVEEEGAPSMSWNARHFSPHDVDKLG